MSWLQVCGNFELFKQKTDCLMNAAAGFRYRVVVRGAIALR